MRSISSLIPFSMVLGVPSSRVASNSALAINAVGESTTIHVHWLSASVEYGATAVAGLDDVLKSYVYA